MHAELEHDTTFTCDFCGEPCVPSDKVVRIERLGEHWLYHDGCWDSGSSDHSLRVVLEINAARERES